MQSQEEVDGLQLQIDSLGANNRRLEAMIADSKKVSDNVNNDVEYLTYTGGPIGYDQGLLYNVVFDYAMSNYLEYEDSLDTNVLEKVVVTGIGYELSISRWPNMEAYAQSIEGKYESFKTNGDIDIYRFKDVQDNADVVYGYASGDEYGFSPDKDCEALGGSMVPAPCGNISYQGLAINCTITAGDIDSNRSACDYIVKSLKIEKVE